jgi:hypothetical protein
VLTDPAAEVAVVVGGTILLGALVERVAGDIEGDPVRTADVVLESTDGRFAGRGFEGGNSSCETAIAISERKRARKKRLSIQGTGS